MTYLLILRAINAGTTHWLTMADLRDWLRVAGATAVKTVGNTGNCRFTSPLAPLAAHQHVADLLAEHLDFAQPFGLLTRGIFLREMAQTPIWWGNGQPGQHMVLFKLTTYLADQDSWLLHQLTTNDHVFITPHLIFWTVSDQDFRHSAYGQLNGTPFYQQTSTRSYRTVRRLQALLAEDVLY